MDFAEMLEGFFSVDMIGVFVAGAGGAAVLLPLVFLIIRIFDKKSK